MALVNIGRALKVFQPTFWIYQLNLIESFLRSQDLLLILTFDRVQPYLSLTYFSCELIF